MSGPYAHYYITTPPSPRIFRTSYVPETLNPIIPPTSLQVIHLQTMGAYIPLVLLQMMRILVTNIQPKMFSRLMVNRPSMGQVGAR